MKGYKAFKPGLICLGKQYEENTTYEEPEAVICEKGFHFCENPFDVLDHYPLVDDNGNFSEFSEVEALADTKTDDNKKFCTSKIRIGAKRGFSGFIKACVDFVIEKTKYENSGSSGKNSVICCAGNNSIVKAKKGSWITLAEWKLISGEYTPVCVKTEQVDGERIKEDVFYKLVDGEFKEWIE